MTVSDTRNEADDVSGQELARLVSSVGTVSLRLIVKDDLDALRKTLSDLIQRDDIDLILTTGGTGLGPRDNVPEATRSIIDREAPGIAEATRRETFSKTPMSMLSRGVAGTKNGKLIINLPGSPKGVTECFEILRPVLAHAIDQVRGETRH